MSKIKKTLICFCLIMCLVFLASACGKTKSGVDDEHGQGNVITGGTRPDYDKEFDYDSGYTPPDPRDPNKMVTIEMDERSPISFAGGQRTLTVKYNSVLTAENFDLSGIADREFLGLSDKNEDGKYNAARPLDTFKVPYENTQIMPYFAAPDGYTAIDIGSSNPMNLNNIYTGSFKTNGTIAVEKNAIVSGSEGSYPELGVVFNETSRITIDSPFRTDSSYKVDGGTVYALKYNFENMGTNAVSLNAYQINGSGEHTSSYKNRYRMNIDLAPGESISYDYQFKPGGSGNGNLLTYFVSNDDMDAMSLGMSMSVQVTDKTEPETVNSETKYTLGISGTGVTFEDGATKSSLLERELLPAITNDTGAEIVGWYDVSDPTTVWNNSAFELRGPNPYGDGSAPLPRFTMPAKNVTIAPVFAENETRSYIPGSAAVECSGSNASCKIAAIKPFDTVAETGVRQQIGSELVYSGAAGDGITLSTACALSKKSDSALKRNEHTFTYWFKNTGTETVKFTAYQVNDDLVKIDGAKTQEITLAAGQATTATIAAELDASANAYTVMEFGQAQKNARLAVTMSKNAYDKFLLTIDGSDATFENGSQFSYVGSGLPLTGVVNKNADADIAGWYDKNAQDLTLWSHSSYILRDKGSGSTGKEIARFAMPEQNTVIAPVFVKKGNRPLIAASAHGMDYITADVKVSRETKLFTTDIGEAVGAELSYSGEQYNGTDKAFGTAGGFRVMTSAASSSGSSGALKAGEHTFDYWFKNTGTETIKFTAYQVTGGTNIAGGTSSGEITLEPGATQKVSLTVKLTGSNNNAMTIITLGQAQTAAKLAVVMSKSTANEVA